MYKGGDHPAIYRYCHAGYSFDLVASLVIILQIYPLVKSLHSVCSDVRASRVNSERNHFRGFISWLSNSGGSSLPKDQNWRCNAPKPLWSIGCPSLLGLPINLWNFQTAKRKKFIRHLRLQCKQISDFQAFRSTQRSNIIRSDHFLSHHSKLGGGVQSRKLGV